MIYHTYENNEGIKNEFTIYLIEHHWIGPAQHFSFKEKIGLVRIFHQPRMGCVGLTSGMKGKPHCDV